MLRMPFWVMFGICPGILGFGVGTGTDLHGYVALLDRVPRLASVAEAQIDLRRVRHARHQFLSNTLSREYYSYTKMRMKVKILRALLRPNPPDISMEALEFATSDPSLEGPDKLATILLEEAKELLAMDRYERRALSRRSLCLRIQLLQSRQDEAKMAIAILRDDFSPHGVPPKDRRPNIFVYATLSAPLAKGHTGLPISSRSRGRPLALTRAA